MDVAVKVINFILPRAKYHRLFQLVAKEMGAQHVELLFYTKVRWLSRGKCLSRLYQLENEIEIFLWENNLHVQFHNEEFVVMLAYLADVFGHLNNMNLSLQGRDVTVCDDRDKLAGLIARIGVWQARIKVGPIASLPLLKWWLKMNRIDLSNKIKTCIIGTLKSSLLSFDRISTTTCCMFQGTETRLALKLTLMPTKQRSWQSSKFQMRWSCNLKTSWRLQLLLSPWFISTTQQEGFLNSCSMRNYLPLRSWIFLSGVHKNKIQKSMYAVTFVLLSRRWSRIWKVSLGEYKNTLRTDFVHL